MEIAKALSYPLQDKNRILQIGLIALIPIFGQIVIIGYVMDIINSVARGDDTALPDWGNLGENFRHGMVAGIAFIVYMLPTILLSTTGNADNYIGVILALVLGFPLGFLYMVALLRYAAEEKVQSFIDVGKNASIALEHTGKLVGTYAVIFAFNTLAFISSFVLTLGFITICLSFFVLAYMNMVNGYLLGDLAKRLNLELPQEEIFFTVSQPSTVPNALPVESIPTPQQAETTHYVVESQAPKTLLNPINLDYATKYEIQVPKITKFEPERAESLVKQILTQVQDIIFAIVAENGSISWQIWDIRQGYNPDLIKQAVKSVYPQADITVSALVNPEFTNPFWRDFVVFKQYEHFVAPIKYVTELTKLDPLAHLVQGMSELKEGERITHLLYVPSMIDEKTRKDAHKKITQSNWLPSLDLSSLEKAVGSIIGSTIAGVFSQKVARYDPSHQKIYEERLYNHILMNCYLLTQIDVLERERSSRWRDLHSSIFQFHGEENALAFDEQLSGSEAVLISDEQLAQQSDVLSMLGSWIEGVDLAHKNARAVLSTFEIASLWHLPYVLFSTPEIRWQNAALPTKEILENEEGTIIGDAAVSDTKQPVRIHQIDRETHMYAIGMTGTGKSTFLHNTIHQDILDGKGVGVLDAHGKLVRDILRLSIPDDRLDDVVVIDIRNFENPPPLNPLQAPGRDDNYAAGEVVSILETVEGALSPRIANSLNAAFVTIRKEKTPTVRDVVKLFRDPEYRYQFIDRVEDPITQDYWEDYEQMSPSRQDELRQPIMHRMGRFYRNPVLYPILCHPQPINFQDLIRDKRIVLMSLGIDEAQVPDLERRLVGVSLIKQFQMAAMSSLEMNEFFLYIDEVQNFITAPLDVILEQARKFGLRLGVANQYLGQLGRILPSIMGNIGTSVVFQVGQEDAHKLAKYFEPGFVEADLHNMDKYHAAVKTRFRNNSAPAFKIATRPEPKDLFDYDLESEEAEAREIMIRERSIRNYTPMTLEEVLAWLNKRYPRRTFTSPNTEKGRGPIDWSVEEPDDEEANENE